MPPTRSEAGLKPFDPSRDEDLLGSRVSDEVKKELWEAVGESPLGNAWGVASYLVGLLFSIDFSLMHVIFSSLDGRCISSSTRLDNAATPSGPIVRCSHAFSYPFSCYPPDFNPNAVIFAPHQFRQIVLSDIGCAIWLGAIIASVYTWDFVTVFRVYLAPYLW